MTTSLFPRGKVGVRLLSRDACYFKRATSHLFENTSCEIALTLENDHVLERAFS